MVLYRITKDLSYKNGILPSGTVHNLNLPAASIEKLIEVGAISPLLAPPFEAISERWKWRGKRLARAGIGDVALFLSSSDEKIAKVAKIPADLVRQWRRDLCDLLNVKQGEIKSG